MEHQAGFYVVGVGDREDSGDFAGLLYLEEHQSGEFALPVFFSLDSLERYAEGIADASGAETGTVAELRAGRFLFEATNPAS